MIMLKKLLVLNTDNTDPRHNLALEETLLYHVQPGECILYLWQNYRTVVIGRNQDARAECRVETLLSDGGNLVKRLSGGGAVYHDAGNVNFTFLSRKDDFDIGRQTETILRAVRHAGIDAEKNGRNDLTAQGKKFSGHAYYRSGDYCLHHGTLMVDVDLSVLERYLNVPEEKLLSKGVRSVRSRVVNLSDLKQGLRPEMLKETLIRSFSEGPGPGMTEIREEDLPSEEIRKKTEKYSDPEWTFGKKTVHEQRLERRFPWGVVRLDLTEKDGQIMEAALWSDGLAADYLASVPERLRGCPRSRTALRNALLTDRPEQRAEAEDLIRLLVSPS